MVDANPDDKVSKDDSSMKEDFPVDTPGSSSDLDGSLNEITEHVA